MPAMPATRSPYPFFRELFQTFLGDYLKIVEPDTAVHLLPDQARFPVLDVPGWTDRERGALGVVADVPAEDGEAVTILIQVEPEALGPEETSERLGRYFVGLETRYTQPVLLSVVYLQGARPGINLESASLSKVFGMEVLRIFYTAFGLAECRADSWLERPEPLAWALSALMRPVRRTRAEHKLACLRRIEGSGLPAGRRALLTACVEDWMELRPGDRAEFRALSARSQNSEAVFP